MTSLKASHLESSLHRAVGDALPPASCTSRHAEAWGQGPDADRLQHPVLVPRLLHVEYVLRGGVDRRMQSSELLDMRGPEVLELDAFRLVIYGSTGASMPLVVLVEARLPRRARHLPDQEFGWLANSAARRKKQAPKCPF